MTRMPTFRRRFQNLVKVLYTEAGMTGALVNYIVESSTERYDVEGEKKDETSKESKHVKSMSGVEDIV